MLQLTRLGVRGFRGFTQEREFTFDEPVVVLAGENHRGKSSTLNAVEWCLFGEECIGKKSGIRERIDWEVVNRYAGEGGAAVEAHFAGPDGAYIVRRETSGNRRRSAVTLTLPDGTALQGEEAERRMASLFRSSFRDFLTTVYQHQETVRGILTEEARERNDAIDRLLGLSGYRELLRGVRAAKLDEAQRATERAFEGLRIRAEQSVRTYDNLIREEEAEAMSQGLRRESMTEQEALRLAAEVGEAMRSLAADLEIVDFQVEPPQRYEEIPRFREWVKGEADDLWARAPDVRRQEAMARQQRELATLKGQYEVVRERDAGARQALDAFIRQNGNETALAARVEEGKAKLSRLDNQIREIHGRAKLVGEAIEYLRATARSDGGVARCPLCAGEAPDLLVHLRSEWEESIKGEVEELERDRQATALQLEGLASLRGQLSKLEREAAEATFDLAGCLSRVATALGREVGKGDDPGALLGNHLREIGAEAERTAQAIEQKRQKLSGGGGIYDQLARLRTLDEIIKHQRKRAIVERIWETPEVARLDELRDAAARLVEDVGVIRSCLAAAARQEAQDKIQAAGASLSEYFTRMASHPAIPGLVMEVTEDSRTGLNSYAFKGVDGTDPTPILSQGDYNCLALSIFLGLARATSDSQPFGFIMLDDPAQSLGSEGKRRLVSVLGEVASWRRVIVSTPDSELKELIATEITRRKAVYDFLDWTERDGPRVVRSS